MYSLGGVQYQGQQQSQKVWMSVVTVTTQRGYCFAGAVAQCIFVKPFRLARWVGCLQITLIKHAALDAAASWLGGIPVSEMLVTATSENQVPEQSRPREDHDSAGVRWVSRPLLQHRRSNCTQTCVQGGSTLPRVMPLMLQSGTHPPSQHLLPCCSLQAATLLRC